jgi:hypothetical protein
MLPRTAYAKRAVLQAAAANAPDRVSEGSRCQPTASVEWIGQPQGPKRQPVGEREPRFRTASARGPLDPVYPVWALPLPGSSHHTAPCSPSPSGWRQGSYAQDARRRCGHPSPTPLGASPTSAAELSAARTTRWTIEESNRPSTINEGRTRGRRHMFASSSRSVTSFSATRPPAGSNRKWAKSLRNSRSTRFGPPRFFSTLSTTQSRKVFALTSS